MRISDWSSDVCSSDLILMLVAKDGIAGLVVLPALIILCREVLVSGLREFLATLNVGLPVSRLAKWKTMLQMVALGFLIERSEEHTSELQSLMRISYAVFCLKKKKKQI